MSRGSRPQRIEPIFHEKVWGSPRIEPWFASRGDQLTGEVWFPADDLLIKFLFTSGNLSVQVHPADDFAGKHENSRGKTEMWHILRADPGARIALGFQRPISAEELDSSARSGEIMDLLNWVEVHPGETYFIPAGTVHAIGAGIALCEIQENSDITYRLYDYGRDRPLHIEQALKVADLGVYVPCPEKLLEDDLRCLVECGHFRTCLAVSAQARSITGSRFLIVLEGSAAINGLHVVPGDVVRSNSAEHWDLEPDDGPSGSLKVLTTG